MKVMIIYADLSFRGGERLFNTLAKSLIAKKHQVTLVVGRVNKKHIKFPNKVKIIKPFSMLNTLFINPLTFIFLSIPFTFFSIFQNARNVDLIISGESFLCLWPAILTSKLLNKPLMLLVFELSDKIPNGNSPFVLFQRLLINLNIWFIKNNLKYAITINEFLIPILKDTFQIPYVRYVIPGIDIKEIKKAEKYKAKVRNKLNNKRIIIMPGILHFVKQQKTAIESIKLIKKSFPDTILLLIGEGNTEYIFKLKQIISKLKLNDSVIFTGYINDKKLNTYYAASDVIMQCGPIAGLTIIEGLILNKMTIYPSSGKPPSGPTEPLGVGFVIPENKPKLYANTIIDYFQNPKKYKQKIIKDGRKVRKLFALEPFAKEVLNIYLMNRE